ACHVLATSLQSGNLLAREFQVPSMVGVTDFGEDGEGNPRQTHHRGSRPSMLVTMLPSSRRMKSPSSPRPFTVSPVSDCTSIFFHFPASAFRYASKNFRAASASSHCEAYRRIARVRFRFSI